MTLNSSQKPDWKPKCPNLISRSRSPIRRDRAGHFPPRREGNHNRERNTNGNGYAKKKDNRKLKNFAPREQPRPKPYRNVTSEDSIHYSSIGSPEDKHGTDSLAIIHDKFRILANRNDTFSGSQIDLIENLEWTWIFLGVRYDWITKKKITKMILGWTIRFSRSNWVQKSSPPNLAPWDFEFSCVAPYIYRTVNVSILKTSKRSEF